MTIPAQLFAPLPRGQEQAERITTPPAGFWSDAWRRFKFNRLALLGLVVLAAFVLISAVGPMLSSYTYDAQDLVNHNLPPSAQHWLGTDDNGRDLYVRLLYGGRISLAVAFVAGLVQLGIGVVYGAIAGLGGGLVDNVMMRFVDILDTIPALIWVILLAVLMGSGLTSMFLAIGLVYWTEMSRIVRAQVLALKGQEFMLAARALGAGHWRLILRHLIPNSLAPIIVALTFSIPRAILTEAFLSFLGLGVAAPMASWGVLASDGYKGLQSYPWEITFPALAIMFTTLAFNFVGDGLRDALDPKLRR